MLDKIFNYDGRDLQTRLDDTHQALFAAKDVCDILGLTDARKAVQSLDDDEKLTGTVFRSGQRRSMWFVNESGLYHLIFQSRKPEAKKFRKWVTSEVLPSIRQHGFYLSQRSDEDKIDFVRRIIQEANYGEISEKTGLRRLIPVMPHFRSCKIAKANDNQPYLFPQETIQ